MSQKPETKSVELKLHMNEETSCSLAVIGVFIALAIAVSSVASCAKEESVARQRTEQMKVERR